MTALVTSAVTLVTVLLSLFSIDSMFRPDLAAEVREVDDRPTRTRRQFNKKCSF